MNREMTITEILNTGLAFMGWLFIMVQAGKLYDAFDLQSIEPGTTVRLATKGALTIMMFRSEADAK